MLIDASQHEETRMAIIHDEKLIEYESEVIKFKPIKGNIYLAKIIRVEPSLQAAFVDYGAQRHGFLAYNEIHPDYFKIPTSDKEKILAEENISSSNYTIDENDEDFNENDSNITDLSESEGKSLPNKRSFLDKVFDFFNYAPIEDEDVIKNTSHSYNNFAFVKLISRSNPFSLATLTISAFFILLSADIEGISGKFCGDFSSVVVF